MSEVKYKRYYVTLVFIKTLQNNQSSIMHTGNKIVAANEHEAFGIAYELVIKDTTTTMEGCLLSSKIITDLEKDDDWDGHNV